MSCGCGAIVDICTKSLIFSFLDKISLTAAGVEAVIVVSGRHIGLKSCQAGLICIFVVYCLSSRRSVSVTVIVHGDANSQFAVPIINSLLFSAAKNIRVSAENILNIVVKKSAVGHLVSIHVIGVSHRSPVCGIFKNCKQDIIKCLIGCTVCTKICKIFVIVGNNFKYIQIV